jgi:hypothetical protein
VVQISNVVVMHGGLEPEAATRVARLVAPGKKPRPKQILQHLHWIQDAAMEPRLSRLPAVHQLSQQLFAAKDSILWSRHWAGAATPPCQQVAAAFAHWGIPKAHDTIMIMGHTPQHTRDMQTTWAWTPSGITEKHRVRFRPEHSARAAQAHTTAGLLQPSLFVACPSQVTGLPRVVVVDVAASRAFDTVGETQRVRSQRSATLDHLRRRRPQAIEVVFSSRSGRAEAMYAWVARRGLPRHWLEEAGAVDRD